MIADQYLAPTEGTIGVLIQGTPASPIADAGVSIRRALTEGTTAPSTWASLRYAVPGAIVAVGDTVFAVVACEQPQQLESLGEAHAAEAASHRAAVNHHLVKRLLRERVVAAGVTIDGVALNVWYGNPGFGSGVDVLVMAACFVEASAP